MDLACYLAPHREILDQIDFPGADTRYIVGFVQQVFVIDQLGFAALTLRDIETNRMNERLPLIGDHLRAQFNVAQAAIRGFELSFDMHVLLVEHLLPMAPPSFPIVVRIELIDMLLPELIL